MHLAVIDLLLAAAANGAAGPSIASSWISSHPRTSIGEPTWTTSSSNTATTWSSSHTTSVTTASSTTSAPTSGTTQGSDPCSHYGREYFSTQENFKLAAVNVTLPNTNNTGVPITLGPIANTDHATRAFATLWSVGSEEFPTFSLVKGGLIASNQHRTGAFSKNYTSGVLQFEVSSQPLQAAPIYCSVRVGSYPYPRLALDGVVDRYQLCQGTGKEGGYPWIIVVNPVSGKGAPYIKDTCYPVALNIIQ